MSDEDQQDDPNMNEGQMDSGEMGDEEEEEGGNKKLFIIIGAVVVLLLGGGAGAYFAGLFDGLLGVEKKEEMAEGEEGDAKKEDAKEDDYAEEGDGKGGTKFIEIPTMIVNLNTEDGTPRYLRLSVQLELKKAEDVPKVEAVMPRVVDQFQTYLRELRVRDLRGSAGIYRLQMELLWRVNQAAAPVKVKDVLFQEILIQ